MRLVVAALLVIFVGSSAHGQRLRKVSDAQKLPDNAVSANVFRPQDPEGMFTELARRESIRCLTLSPNTENEFHFAKKLTNLETLVAGTNIPLAKLAPLLSEFKNVKCLKLTMR